MAQEWGFGLSEREINYAPSSLGLVEDLIGEEELRLIGTATPTFDSVFWDGKTGAGANLVFNLANVAVGAHCFAFISWGAASETYTGTGPSAWTKLLDSTPVSSTLTYSLWYYKTQAGDTTFTWTAAGGAAKGTWGLVSYTGLDPTTPYQVVTASNKGDLSSGPTSIFVSTGSVASTDIRAWPVQFFNIRSNTGSARDIHFYTGSLVEHLDVNNNFATAFPFLGVTITDGGGPIGDTSAHSYTANSNTSESYGGGILIYINQVATGETVFLGRIPI